MRRLIVFNNESLDGYFCDENSDMSWAHQLAPDKAWERYSADNAKNSSGTLLFGRKTYDLMSSFWPTDQAKQQMPEVAKGMNAMEKLVFSRTLRDPTWNNTKVLEGDPVELVKRLKAHKGETIVIMGSGSLIAPLTTARLIDQYIVVVCPIVLGKGRTMFDGAERLKLTRTESRSFDNGNVVNTYEPA